MLAHSYNSYAKLNLFLSIIGHSNNYHLLQSLFVNIDLHDIITITPSTKNNVIYTGSFASSIDTSSVDAACSNIINKTLGYFSTNFSIEPVDIIVNKQIPVGSGLGGASSNCATLMLALNEIFKLNLSFNLLLKIASSFGADVAFFLYNKLSFVEGFGEIVTPLKFNINNLDVIVIFPNTPLSTKEVFNNFSLTKNYATPIKHNTITPLSIFKLCNNTGNALQNSAMLLNNDVALILNWLKTIPTICHGLTGSGSACFAIVNRTNLDETLKLAQTTFTDFKVYKSKIITP